MVTPYAGMANATEWKRVHRQMNENVVSADGAGRCFIDETLDHSRVFGEDIRSEWLIATVDVLNCLVHVTHL